MKIYLSIAKIVSISTINNLYFAAKVWCVLLAIILLHACNQNNNHTATLKNNTQDSIMLQKLFSQTKINKDSSNFYLLQAEKLAKKSIKNEAIYLGLLGKEMIMTGQLDSAYIIAEKGLQLKYEPNFRGLQAKFFNIKGNVAGFKKNIYESIDYYLKAEKIYESTGDSAALAGIYSNMANSYFSLKDYPTANQYATQAYSLLPSIKENNIASNIITTYALSLNKIGKDREALIVVKMADSLADATQNKLAKISATIGLAEIYNATLHYDSAQFYYKKCSELSKEIGVKHFELMSQIGLMAMYEAQGKTVEIISHAQALIELANQIQNKDVLHTAKRIVGKAYGQQGQYQKGFQFLNESYSLYDSVAGVENQKNINELLVKYDAEKKENEILKQKYQLDNQNAALKLRLLYILVLLLVLMTLVALFIYFRKLNVEKLKRIALEDQQKITDAFIIGEERERKRVSYEIHDGIAGMVTGAILKLQSKGENKNEVIELLQKLHEDSRRLSHNLRPVDFDKENLIGALENLCRTLSTEQTDISFLNREKTIELDNIKSTLFYRTVQELINNALKYAHCSSIFVSLEKVGDNISVSVQDDGLGLSAKDKNNGFNSLKERVRALNGTLIIESEIGEGTTIKIQNVES